MKTKNIFKALAMAMLMPAMMLTTACSSEDDAINNSANTENTINKGYALPVTVNVTREGDGATRASFDGSKLNFSTGDKLFVGGNYDDWNKSFAGTLDYDAESGKFKGTIYTQDDTYKTYEALFAASDETIATLLPAGYKDHGYLVINTNDPDAQYDDYIEESNEYTLATSKADGVAQFSYEESSSYNDGFALSPNNAILNFTITGLAASTSVNVSLTSIAYNITGTVTTDASGTATFAAGIEDGLNLQSFSLTVAGKNITLVSSDKVVAKGMIYNITRNAIPGALIGQFSVSNIKKVFFSKGNLQATTTDLGATWTWAFAANQWSCVGDASANKSMKADGTGTVTANGTVDLFGWVGASSSWTTAAKWGISASNTSVDYGNVADEALKSDWGNVPGIGTGWRTLTSDEWTYLFNTRTVNGGTGGGKSYTLGQSVNGKLGVVLYPDNYTGAVYSGSDWATFESAGCVFLPAAGYRNGSSVLEAGTVGIYRSATPNDADKAYNVDFYSGDLNPAANGYVRGLGFSVRLVREVE